MLARSRLGHPGGRPLRAATPDVYDGQAMKPVSLLSQSCQSRHCRSAVGSLGSQDVMPQITLLLSTCNAFPSPPVILLVPQIASKNLE